MAGACLKGLRCQLGKKFDAKITFLFIFIFFVISFLI